MKKESLEKLSKILFWIQITLLILFGLAFLMLFISPYVPVSNSNVEYMLFGGIVQFILLFIFFIEFLLVICGFILSIILFFNKKIKNKKWGILLLIMSIIFLVYEVYVIWQRTRVYY